MASEKQIAANRANAKKSTGPKTPTGKLKSSRNAYRHGLSGPLLSDPATSAKVDWIPVRLPATRRVTIDKRQLGILLAPKWSCCGFDRSDPDIWPKLI